MSLRLVLLVVLVFSAGVFAGEKRVYYRVDPVDANQLLIACKSGRPEVNYRIDDVLRVYCHTPNAQKH